MADMPDVERLMAIQQIQELQARRCLAVDTRDWVTHKALHAPDFRSYQAEIDAWVTEGADAYTERVAAIHANRTSAHYVHTPILSLESPTRAGGLWTMEDHVWWRQGDEDHWLHGFGFYDETYRRVAGTWLFASRSLSRHKVLMSPGADFARPATPVE